MPWRWITLLGLLFRFESSHPGVLEVWSCFTLSEEQCCASKGLLTKEGEVVFCKHRVMELKFMLHKVLSSNFRALLPVLQVGFS